MQLECIEAAKNLLNVQLSKVLQIGLISEFRRLYIKTGVFDTRLSQIISVLFDMRNDSDYDDFFVVSKEEVVEQIKNAEYFLNEIKKYLDNIRTE